jgi:16S rRNA (uracil1498-N3)-methyltransferase
MHRFFIPPESFARDTVTITDGAARQITRVLRLKPGEHIVVLDNTGWEYETIIDSISRDEVIGKIARKALGAAEPCISVTLCQALITVDKFEFVLQKGTELGVSAFWPFISGRCVAAKPSEEKIVRWQAVIREATEQCGRTILPILYPTVDFEQLCQPSPVPTIILWEHETSYRISKALRSREFKETRLLRLFVGPEGGFTEIEVELARQQGIVPVGLGKRILRAETAGLAAVSAIMYEMRELG